MRNTAESKHYEESQLIPASAEGVFAFVDDHARFSSHMSKSSLIMGGGQMKVWIDKGQGQEVGSHIKLEGKAFGIPLSLDEVVTKHESPYLKVWETVGSPQLIVVGHYQMMIKIKPEGGKSLLTVSIDYEPPAKNKWLGKLFGGIYAKWCVNQMVKGARTNFIEKER